MVSLIIDIQQLLGDSIIFKVEKQMLKMTLGQGPLSQKQIEQVRVLIQDDRLVTYDILEVLTLLSRNTFEWIIHDHLGYKKKASRWIPRLLTPRNRQRKLDFFKY